MKPITIPIPQGELIAIIPESDGNYIYNSTENKPIVFDYESIKNLRHTPIEVMRGDIEIIGKWSEITEEMAERWGFERIHYESNHMPSNENLLDELASVSPETFENNNWRKDLLFIVVKNKEE